MSQPSARLWPSKRSSLAVEVGVCSFAIALGLVALALAWTHIIRGTLSSYQTLDLGIFCFFIALGVLGLAWFVPREVRGAILLRLNDEGFELAYPSGRHFTKRWNDADLSFDLFDFTAAKSLHLAVPEFPHSIRVKGVESLLTAEAFSALREKLSHHQLLDSQARGRRWTQPSDSSQVIYRVRATPHEVRPSSVDSRTQP